MVTGHGGKKEQSHKSWATQVKEVYCRNLGGSEEEGSVGSLRKGREEIQTKNWG